MPLFSLTRGGWFRAHNATLTGDVQLGALSSVWFNAVIRGDEAPIRIGMRVNIQDHALIHCDHKVPHFIEDDVTIGHAAVVHGSFIGAGSLIGMNATLLGKSRIGRRCLIAAGALVPPGMEVPDGVLVAGVPGKVIRPLKEKDFEYMSWLSGHYVELAQRHLAGEFDRED